MITSSKGPWILYFLLALVFAIATVYVGLDYGGSHSPLVQKPKTETTTTKKVSSSITPIPPRHICSHTFETGMVFPRWTKNGYGPKDVGFGQGLPTLTEQTSACWLEMPLLFKMQTPNSLVFDTSSVPSPEEFAEGIANARTYGFHIFVVPLVTVTIKGGWAGSVQFHSIPGETQWFSLLFAAYAPYLKVAQAEHVEQVSIGTELEWMQRNAPDSLWENYLGQVKALYHGKVLYNTNWSDVSDPIQPWMRHLSTMGVSEYFSLIDKPWRIAPPAMDPLFKDRVESRLDAFSEALGGKPIIVSEIGFRNSFDALYNPWDTSVHLPQDQQEQAWIVQAALDTLSTDPHVEGVFFWAWSGSGTLDLQGTQAAQVIGSMYRKI